MKKLTALLLALLMMFVFAACGSSDKDDDDDKKKDDEIIETTLANEDEGTSNDVIDNPVIDTPVTDAPVIDNPALTDAQKVAKFVEDYNTELISAFASGFSGAGMTADTTITAEGCNVVLETRIHEFDNLPEEAKKAAQDSLNSSKASMSAYVKQWKAELPEMDKFIIRMCEVDGDVIATLTVDGTEADTPVVDTPVTDAPVVDSAAAQKVAAYVNANKSYLISSFESAFTGSGMTCTTTIEIEGAGFILKVCINELEGLTAEQKATMQSTYDSMASTFSSSLDMMRIDLPELEYYKVLVCEKDGDLIATITAE